MKNDFELLLFYPHSLIPVVYCQEELNQLLMDQPRLNNVESSVDTLGSLVDYNNKSLIISAIIQMS